MTIAEFTNIIKKYNIPSDATIEADTGWEGGPVGVYGAYYNENENSLVLTQDDTTDYNYIYPQGEDKNIWKIIYTDLANESSLMDFIIEVTPDSNIPADIANNYVKYKLASENETFTKHLFTKYLNTDRRCPYRNLIIIVYDKDNYIKLCSTKIALYYNDKRELREIWNGPDHIIEPSKFANITMMDILNLIPEAEHLFDDVTYAKISFGFLD